LEIINRITETNGHNEEVMGYLIEDINAAVLQKFQEIFSTIRNCKPKSRGTFPYWCRYVRNKKLFNNVNVKISFTWDNTLKIHF
jgi:hypothetical protein